MNFTDRLRQIPYLKYSLLFYFLLGGLDMVHHLHVALVLGRSTGMHAVIIGSILMPLAAAAVMYFLHSKNVYSLGLFLLISTSAIAFLGFYHGGWDHVTKVLAYLRVDGDTTDIRSLFPLDNLHLWFYEISGSVEFVLGIIATYFSYKLMSSVTAHKISAHFIREK